MLLQGKKVSPLPYQNGRMSGLSSVLEADAKEIAAMAHETFDKYVELYDYWFPVLIFCEMYEDYFVFTGYSKV